MTRLRLLLSTALALAACGKSATTPDYAGGTPAVSGLTLETNGTADGLVASAPSTGASALSVEATTAATTSVASLPTCNPWEFTCNIHRAIVGLNYFVHAAVSPVEVLVASGTATDLADDVRVYGPMALPVASPVANFQLTVRFLGDDTFRWKLEAAPLSPAGSAFVVVMVGQLHRGDAPHRGRGFLGIDLDALRGVNATAFPGEGKLLAAFAHAGAAKAVAYAVQGFSADGVAQPVTAGFVGWKDALGVARVRVAALGEFAPPYGGGTDTLDELLLSRIGYWPTIGGQTVVAVLGGDVPSYSAAFTNFTVQAVVGKECFDPTVTITYRAEFICGTDTSVVPNVARCVPNTTFNGGADAVNTTSAGVPTVAGACPTATDLYDPAAGLGTDASSTALEPGAPVIPDVPPTAMPSF